MKVVIHGSWGSRGAVAWLALGLPLLGVAGQIQEPAPFRAEVVLVPVSVRVVRGDGSPVTDLTSEDFEIYDNGVKQNIRQFSIRSALTQESTPRTFGIVLGRGYLTKAGAIQATIGFVRSRVLPRDRVCVVAYQRATEPTLDHDAIIRLLERYEERHEQIEALLGRDQRRGLGAPVRPLSDETQANIQALFANAFLPKIQQLPGGGGGRASAYSDFSALVRGIEYLRHIDGDKHLVFLSDRAPPVGNVPDYLTRKAAAARVTVSFVQTGGLATADSLSHGRVDPFGSLSADEVLHSVGARAAAVGTGGWASLNREADRALEWWARATSLEYLLGYYPADLPKNGEYRPIEVKVNRRGVTVLYRRGYESQPRADESLDVRRLLVQQRIREIAARAPVLSDSAHSAPSPWTRASAARAPGDTDGTTRVTVGLAIDPRRVTFTRIDGVHTLDIDLAIFVTDARGNPLGEYWGRLERTFAPEAYERLKKQRIEERVVIRSERRPTQVKVVLYEYDSDRGSSVTARVR